MLYCGIVGFGITMLFVIRAPEIGWASIFIFVPFTIMVLHTLTRRESYGDADAIAQHLADFPYDRGIFESHAHTSPGEPPAAADRAYASRRN
jgi:hypothetical protein